MNSPISIPTNYFAIIRQGAISGVVEATPRQALSKGQIPLTKAEFDVIRALSLHNIYEAEALKALLSIQAKIKSLSPKAKRSKRK